MYKFVKLVEALEIYVKVSEAEKRLSVRIMKIYKIADSETLPKFVNILKILIGFSGFSKFFE